MAIIMELLGNWSRSSAHDVCRWYQDYRNAKIGHSARKQALVPDVVVWASRILDLLGS